MWLAGGQGTNIYAYSYDSINWTTVSTFVLSFIRGFAWNGIRWVATGGGSGVFFAYSTDGLTWTAITYSNIYEFYGANIGGPVVWNGTIFIASGPGNSAYSGDGINWTGSVDYYSTGKGIGVNSQVGARVFDNKLILNNNNQYAFSNANANTITFATDPYFQAGCNSISITMKSRSS
jgi:hypothetical protein